MKTTQFGSTALALLVGAPFVFLASPAAAHCENGSMIGNLVNSCLLMEPIEDVLVDINAALGGDMAFVLARERRFHPEVVTIRTGGTVVWLYADAVNNADNHDPRDSGTCGSQEADLNRCGPSSPNPAPCFDVKDDLGQLLKSPGDFYHVTFTYAPATGQIEKSFGLRSGTLVGDLTGAGAFIPCPSFISSNTPERAVIPYHCAIHGGLFTIEKGMRGAVIVTP